MVPARQESEATAAGSRISSDAWLKAIIQSSEDAIIAKDLNGIIRTWNAGAERLFGYTAEEAIGQPVAMLAVPEREDEMPRILSRIRKGERVEHFETERRTKDGRILAISLTVSPIRDASGVIIGASKIARDITDRKRAEQTLQAQTSVLEMIARGTPLPEVLTALCEAAERHVPGSTCSILLLDRQTNKLHLAAGPHLPEWFREVLQDGISAGPDAGSCGAAAYRREPVITTDIATDPRWATGRETALRAGFRSCWSRPIFGHMGEALGTFGMFLPVPRGPRPEETEALNSWLHLASIAVRRLQAESALRESEQRLKLITDSLPVLISYVDADERYRFNNLTHERWFGVSPSDLAGRLVSETPGSDVYSVLKPYIQSALSGNAEAFEELLPSGSAPARHVHGHFVPDLDEDGRVRGYFCLIEDITERRRLSDSVRDSEARYRFLADALPQFVWTRDSSGNLDYVNRQWKEYTGLTLEQAQSGDWLHLVHPDDRSRLVESAALREVGRDFECEFRFFRKSDGQYRWHLVRGCFVPQSGGGARWIGTATDIHDRKQLEESLRHAAQRFRLALKNSPISVFEQDLSLRYTWAHNESPIFKPEVLLGKTDEDLNPGLWCDQVSAIKRRILQTGAGERHEIEIPVEGEIRTYDFTLEPLRGANSEITGISGAAVNITALKRTEKDLRVREAQWRFLANALPQFVWVASPEGLTTFLNEYWFEYTGLSPDSDWDQDMARVVHPDDLPDARQAWRNARLTCQEVAFEYRVRRASDGAWRWHLGIHKPELNEDGVAERWVGVGIDIHDRKEAESRFRFLAEASSVLASSLDPGQTLRTVAQLAVPVFADWSSVDILDDSGKLQRLAVYHSDPAKREFAEWFHRRYPPAEGDAVIEVTRTGKSLFLSEIPNALIEERARDAEQAQLVRQLGLRSLLVVPMVARGRVLGAISFATAESGRRYHANDVSFAEDLAGRAAVALDNARLYAAVHDSEARLRLLFDTAAEGICLCDAEGRALLANPRMNELMGCADVAGRILFEFVAEEYRDAARAGFLHRFQGDAAPAREYPVQHPDGSRRWVRILASPLRDPGGEVQSVLGMFSDVTELRRAMDEVRASEERFRELSNAVPALVWRAGADGRMTYFNSRWYAYTGLSTKESLDQGWQKVVHPEDRIRMLHAWNEALATEANYEVECRYRDASGEYRWFMARAVPVHDGSGEVLQWFGTSTDIHDAKETEAALRRANAELEEFAYVASHDLQEPLRMVNIYSQLLVKRKLTTDAVAAEYSQFIRNGVLKIEALISDLLSYSRVIHGDSAPQGQADLAASMASAAETYQSRIREAGATLIVDALPAVRGDASQFAHVFQNLLSNALKYRKPGIAPEIRVSAVRRDGHWVVTFRDNGIGFDQIYAERIFGLFKRLHKDEYPGTGLGLAICQRIVERYGGRMWAESAPDQGATFHFTAPAVETDS